MHAAWNVHYYEDRHKGEDSYSTRQQWIMNEHTEDEQDKL